MQSTAMRRGAVQVVMLASASLSAAYNATQAPPLTIELAGLAVPPIAVGLGLTAFALDLVKPEMLRIAVTGGSGAAQRLAAGLLFLVLFVASMIAVDGVLMRLRSDRAAGRGVAISGYADALKVVTDLEAEFAKVATARTTEQVRAAMDAVRISARTWADTVQCTRLADDADRRQCRPILDLREEMAGAIRKADLDPKLTAARAKLAGMAPPKAADPQAEALASMLGLEPATVGYLMVAIIGLALELTACLGVWIMAQPTSPTPRAVPAVIEPQPLVITGPVPGPVAGLERIAREIAARGGRLTAENVEIAALLGVSPSCASKWRKAWRDAGEIIEGKSDGRLVITTGRRRVKVLAAA